jgi:hypothetical protein
MARGHEGQAQHQDRGRDRDDGNCVLNPGAHGTQLLGKRAAFDGGSARIMACPGYRPITRPTRGRNIEDAAARPALPLPVNAD